MSEHTEAELDMYIPRPDPDAQPIKALRDPLDPNTCNENKKGMYTSRFVVREHVKFREHAIRKDFTEITDLLAKALKAMDEKYEQYTEELGHELERVNENHKLLIRAYTFTHSQTRKKIGRLQQRWWERLACDIDADVMHIRNWWNKRRGRNPIQEVTEQLDIFKETTEGQNRG